MSLATRCTTCGTVFRVVQDQLKVSEGWVRCGRCDEVFNAIEGLFDLERDAPPNWKPPPAAPAPPAAAISATFISQPEPPDDDDVFQLSDGDRVHSRFFHPEQADVDQTPAQAVKDRDRFDFADAQFNADMIDEDAPTATTEARAMPRIERSSVKLARARQAAERRGPDFVQQAQARERWRTPRMRIVLSLCALVAAFALCGQIAFHFRDLLAAQSPSMRHLLATGCEVLHCTLGNPRRIDDVAVDSSSLSPAPGAANTYRLSVVLHNRGALALAMPWIDLSLTDPSGTLVVRRALSPADFRIDHAVLPPNGDSTLQMLLSADGRRISGYTVEIFYP